MSVTDVELAYAAGIIDGEGYIGIRKKASSTGATQQYQFGIQVSNTRPELVRWLHVRFAGSVSGVRQIPGNKPSTRWEVQSSFALPFLKAIRPYLVIKAEQADIAIEFQTLVATQANRGRRVRPYSVSERYEELYGRLRQLNQRGDRTYTPALSSQLHLQEVAAQAS